jgi:predicted aspartyl protease
MAKAAVDVMLGMRGKSSIYRFPSQRRRMRIFHNIQEAETMEYMGRSMPRIYASLDNKEDKYQSPMIEVEGKINSEPISNLIDSGASHSYINANIVERIHLQISKHNKFWIV